MVGPGTLGYKSVLLSTEEGRGASTQYMARFAGELASYIAFVEEIKEKKAAAAAKDLIESIRIVKTVYNLKRLW